jgi:uncharacterized membrane protein YphA (DoxX/SURF4 family)
MKKILHLAGRLILGGILLYASMGKLTHAEEFSTAVANYRMLPSSLILAGSLTIPWLEFVLGLSLITGFWRSTVTFLTACLFLVFTIGVVQALARGIDISCGCFNLSGTGEKIGSLTLLRNLLLFAMSLWLMVPPGKNPAERTAENLSEA